MSSLGHNGLMKVISGNVDLNDKKDFQEKFLIDSSELQRLPKDEKACDSDKARVTFKPHVLCKYQTKIDIGLCHAICFLGLVK